MHALAEVLRLQGLLTCESKVALRMIETQKGTVRVDVLCALHDCALRISPVTSYSGVKN